MQGFSDWLVDNNFSVLNKEKFNRGEVIAFIGKGGRGSLYETGYANEQCIKMVSKYLRSVK